MPRQIPSQIPRQIPSQIPGKLLPTLAMFALSVFACGAEDPAPVAIIVETNPLTIEPSVDQANDLSILVHYRDADADLGGGILEIHDCRAGGFVARLTIPPIATMGAIDEGVAIEGDLDVTFNDIGLVPLDAQAPPVCADLGVAAPSAGTATFCVVLIDMAQNVGPGDCTPPITIL